MRIQWVMWKINNVRTSFYWFVTVLCDGRRSLFGVQSVRYIAIVVSASIVQSSSHGPDNGHRHSCSSNGRLYAHGREQPTTTSCVTFSSRRCRSPYFESSVSRRTFRVALRAPLPRRPDKSTRAQLHLRFTHPATIGLIGSFPHRLRVAFCSVLSLCNLDSALCSFPSWSRSRSRLELRGKKKQRYKVLLRICSRFNFHVHAHDARVKLKG